MLRRIICLSLLCLGLAACGAIQAPLPEGVTAVAPAQPIPDMTLVNTQDAPVAFSDFAGKYTLLAFGYTSCPDVCPLTLAEFKSIKKSLDASTENLQFMFVAVDPARDTPERIGAYLSKFDPTFIGLTGTPETLTAFIGAFGGQFVINDYAGLVENYTVDHTASKFLIDPSGSIIRKYTYGMNTQFITEDLRQFVQ